MIVTVPKIRKGPENSAYPDTTAKNWSVIEEREKEMVIEIRE